MRNLWKWPLSVVLIAVILCCMVLTPQTAYAWKTKTHGYSANLLLNEVKKGYVTVDGKNYTIPQEYREAIEQYPNAFRAGTLGPDFYPDMLTGQSYIHPYDADAGIGVGDWLMELVKGVNSLPKNSNARKEALAFTLGMAIHYAGDMFGHDFINAFAGGAYPAYADVVKDESQDKLYYIIRHMAEESYMDSLIGSRIGSTDVSAPEKFIMNTWIYEGTANAGSAKIYSKYSGGMMYQYKYLVEMRQKLYQYAEKNRYEIWPPVPQIVQYLDKWIEDLDTATYRLIVTFDDIAHDFLTGVKGKSDIQIVT
ncbi:MAG: zinc dependent phospholipase C family protein, partial [Clostridia bacterium]|nr:zinc dependent phospholipase C family protein [Clostridia bacterium]